MSTEDARLTEALAEVKRWKATAIGFSNEVLDVRRWWDRDREKLAAVAALADDEALVRRLFVALTEQRVIDGHRYGEFPYAPITMDHARAALADVSDGYTGATSAWANRVAR